MNFIKTAIEDIVIIEPLVFEDERGHFFEYYQKELFKKNGIEDDFVQDNQSLSQKGVLRGLHFQAPPYAQAKLIRVIKGSVLDVAVDIRKNSPTYGKHVVVELSETNKKTLYIPEGFAHGFLTLADNTIFSYKCSNYYNKVSEGALLWNDKDLAINWGVTTPILSEKDKVATTLKSFSTPF
ncbi:MAG: dTDP-4-dehydrorhamnose 3,5-epimerase [Flavobacteriales bacterium]|nr:dTDP-4-dehydrorhamnose 3,5-epimerase [Flavobacteriales bacterium]MCW8912970.1 dTDP-4-dehydrorhamnose 3,5-epimerase [Flavobacteriales bacterium]MCW8938772.1 dTDP-4-dehydrorhamnose 3,5-epimerase [Flavobacteriales bacterium]MCW8939099.1 dTDP-4-dehydrorhamnose 3,5-epimerase [Flavobacteriales bacterium]MCW8969187.1 dTDP-4-dehydrorhamnose 3,5-epimerase [Flavobacteriales bacterium]